MVYLQSYEATSTERMDQIESSSSTRIAALELAASVFESWRPHIEVVVTNLKFFASAVHSSIDVLRGDVLKVHKFMEREVKEH